MKPQKTTTTSPANSNSNSRSDSVLDALPLEDQQLILLWLETDSYRKVLHRMAQPESDGGFDLVINYTSLHRWHHKHKLQHLVEDCAFSGEMTAYLLTLARNEDKQATTDSVLFLLLNKIMGFLEKDDLSLKEALQLGNLSAKILKYQQSKAKPLSNSQETVDSEKKMPAQTSSRSPELDHNKNKTSTQTQPAHVVTPQVGLKYEEFSGFFDECIQKTFKPALDHDKSSNTILTFPNQNLNGLPIKALKAA